MHFNNLLKKFFDNFIEFLKGSSEFAFLVKTRENITHGLLRILEKHAKIVYFTQFS